jgi:hypothetical protein
VYAEKGRSSLARSLIYNDFFEEVIKLPKANSPLSDKVTTRYVPAGKVEYSYDFDVSKPAIVSD